MLLCDFASVKRQIGHCESAVEISGGGKIEEEEGKSWYFMGERFIWNTAAEGDHQDKGGLCRTVSLSLYPRLLKRSKVRRDIVLID